MFYSYFLFIEKLKFIKYFANKTYGNNISYFDNLNVVSQI